jgi:tRNA threonylcarbamoyladenosine biosynthesis protein TsaE
VIIRPTETNGEDQTSAVAEAFASSLKAGDVLLLEGELGAGKTAFVRGLARGLRLAADEVTSPTFTLIQEYRGSSTDIVLYHADLYRLTPREVDDLGLGELSEEGILAVEWSDRWSNPPAPSYHVRIEHLGGDRRSITIVRPQEINKRRGEGER